MMSNPLDSEDEDSMDSWSPLKKEFQAASLFVRSATGNLKPDELLYLYARYKQALDGPCNIPRPGFFDFQGKQKWDAWHSLGQMPTETAMSEYVAFVSDRFPDWSSSDKKFGKDSGAGGAAFGARVSTMTALGSVEGDNDVEHDDKIDKEILQAFTLFKSDGLTERVRALLKSKPELAKSSADSAGQTLLHWAADRADEAACRELLKLGSDPNRPDCDGMTPLHTAVASTQSIESVKTVVALLLASGGQFDISVEDESETVKPEDLTDNAEILALLSQAAVG